MPFTSGLSWVWQKFLSYVEGFPQHPHFYVCLTALRTRPFKTPPVAFSFDVSGLSLFQSPDLRHITDVNHFTNPITYRCLQDKLCICKPHDACCRCAICHLVWAVATPTRWGWTPLLDNSSFITQTILHCTTYLHCIHTACTHCTPPHFSRVLWLTTTSVAPISPTYRDPFSFSPWTHTNVPPRSRSGFTSGRGKCGYIYRTVREGMSCQWHASRIQRHVHIFGSTKFQSTHTCSSSLTQSVVE